VVKLNPKICLYCQKTALQDLFDGLAWQKEWDRGYVYCAYVCDGEGHCCRISYLEDGVPSWCMYVVEQMVNMEVEE